ncbi:MAG: S-methyl-5-thioribose-1-phosphate isomerase, partial [Armatimonadetes bacterium]|nr:S-methyl-5-thioribose-1-phosphate isomerase [Armatimonadota bacterium]
MQPIPDTVTLEDTPDGLAVRMIDQTLLPTCEQIIDLTTVPDLCEAIRMLRVRGAPAIGCAAACGVAMAAGRSDAPDLAALQAELRQAI